MQFLNAPGTFDMQTQHATHHETAAVELTECSLSSSAATYAGAVRPTDLAWMHAGPLGVSYCRRYNPLDASLEMLVSFQPTLREEEKK